MRCSTFLQAFHSNLDLWINHILKSLKALGRAPVQSWIHPQNPVGDAARIWTSTAKARYEVHNLVLAMGLLAAHSTRSRKSP